MPAADLDRLFEEIRRTRDPELLATLFERTAPWLLHRARLLLRPANLAEDVVQDLFLGLLENGHGCEPGPPCLPYLVGMLHRRAARVRRQETRTLAQSLREAAGSEGGPVDAAIGAEGRVTVRHAIDSLPEPYRQVVRRFLAQQSPAQIGRELGRTPNAVRVQLHRGLRLLRSTLPPGLAMVLWTVPASPLPAQAPWRRPVQLGAAAMLAVGALAIWFGTAASSADAVAASTVAAAGPVSAAAKPAGSQDGTAPPAARAEAATAGNGVLVLELRYADGTPAASVGVLAHPAGRDPDFGATCVVSETDGRVILRDLPAGPIAVLIDRGLQLCCSVPGATPTPQVVTLPEGVDVTGIVRDAAGQPAAGAGIWLCRDRRCPSEGCVVAHAGDDGRFVLRGVQEMALLGAVREGSIPSLLHAIGSRPGEAELVLGGEGARMSGRVLGPNGAPVAGACVRIARHPRAVFEMPSGRETVPVHPCAIACTDAAGVFKVADLPPGPMQVLVRAPRHRTGLESIVLAPGKEQRVELRLHAGMDLDGEVRDQDGLPIGNASVLARGLARSAWASVSTAPDGSFALAGLDPFRVLLEVDAPGFVPASVPVARDAGRVSVVLHAEARVVLRLQDASGRAARAPEWELAARPRHAAQGQIPEPFESDGDGFVAAGESANGPFVVRRQGTQVWLRAEPVATPNLLRIPAAAETGGALLLSLAGATPEQRADVLLVIVRDGVLQTIAPADASPELLDFGRVPFGDNRAVLFSRTGLLPTVDLGVIAVTANAAPLTVTLPEYGWLRYRLQRTDREPVMQCQAFVADERGMQVPLRGPDGRLALAAGRYQLWASSLSFPTFGHAFEVVASQETVLDLEVNPGKVRHVAFRLPADADPQQSRARVRGAGDRGGEEDFPIANRGFDTTADGLCYTTLVLGEGEYLLDVRCGDRAFRSRFGVAGEDGVAEPIEVELRAER
ncbi:MAG TPA: sigma-70 family RNA polymerase sigma factor [Planctomycetota bacterium]|nr:sigma-70 family RNA polymerase sigma factor [Planctomycetota bacterium]